jgi:peptidoglycan hydrolase-like protein with peptidoglycan-binding domain
MALTAFIFKDDKALEAAAVSNPAHILEGHSGPHVGKIQEALIMLDGAVISNDERLAKFYGPSTSKAVLNYKTKRKIINKAYQSTADAIVGIMTMKALDDELFKFQRSADFTDNTSKVCGRNGGARNLLAVNNLKRLNNEAQA